MIRKLIHPRRFSLFVLLSFTDLFLTILLVRAGDGWMYEGNPIAGWWLERYDWIGLAAFKTGVVFLTCTLLAVISCYRPRTGGRVLSLSCSVLAAVVLYSCLVSWLVWGQPEELEARERTEPLVPGVAHRVHE